MARRHVIAILSLLLSAVAQGQEYFNLFQPPPNAGVMKGSPGTYITTNAAWQDIVALFNTSSTCTIGSTTEYLRVDGNCAVPAGSGSGSVTEVAFAAPTSIFSCTGGPITGSGTITCTYATGQTATELFGTDGSGNVSLFALTGAYVPPINLASTANGGIANTLGVAHGGLGVATLTTHGLLVGEGTSAVSALAALATDTVVMGQGASADPAGAAVPNCGSGSAALSYSTSTHSFGCQTISAGTGTVTSIGMTVPSVLSVSPASITSTGTFALTFAGSQAANMFLATPNGTTGALSLRAPVSADLPPINASSTANGGLTGNLLVGRFNGGTGASSSTCWHGDLTWSACGSSISSGPPTALVGVTAITGSSGTYMDAGSSPAINPAMSPFWTGTQYFAGAPYTTSTATGGVSLGQSSNYPIINLIDTNETTNAKNWRIDAASGATLQYQLASDDWSTTFKNYLAVTRSAAAVTGMLFGNATDNPAYAFLGTGAVSVNGSLTVAGHPVCQSTGTNCPAQPTSAAPTAIVGLTTVTGSTGHFMDAGSAPALSQSISPTWTGQHVFAGSASSGVSSGISGVSLGTDALNGSIQLVNSSGATDSKRWEMLTSPTTLTERLVNDAFTASSVFMQVSRSADTVSGISLGNSTDKPPITLNGAVSIPAPASGTPLIVNGLSGAPVTGLTSTGAAASLNAGWAVGIATGAWNLYSQSTDPLIFGTGGTGALTLVTDGIGREVINSAGVVTIEAPSSGSIALSALDNIQASTGGGATEFILANAGTHEADICMNTLASGAECVVGDAPNEVSLRTQTGESLHLGDVAGDAFDDVNASGFRFHQSDVLAQSTGATQIVARAGSSGTTGSVIAQTFSSGDFGFLCISDTANTCASGVPANDVEFGSIANMHFINVNGPQLDLVGTTATFDGSLVTAPGALISGAGISSTNSVTPSTGTSVDLQVSGGQGYVTTYNHSAPAGVPMVLRGSNITMVTGGGVNVLGVQQFADGGVAVGSPTSADCGFGCFNAQQIEIQGITVPSGAINLAATGTGGVTGTLPAANLPGTITSSTSGNAATASSLASIPSQCSGTQFAKGVTATGAANCGTPAGAIQLVAYGTFSSTCSASISKNMSCSSHTSGSGIYDLSVASAGFPSVPVCTTSTGVAFAQFAFGSSSSTIVQIATYNNSGANADEAFSVICVQ